MYLWKIKDLKRDLKSGPLPPLEQFKYLLIESLLATLVMVPFLSNNWLDVINAAIGIPIVGFGVYYIYRCNGGPTGERLLERFVSLGLVVSIRFLVLILLPALAIYFVVYEVVVGVPEETSVPDIMFANAFFAVFFYFFGKHTKEVRA